MRSHRILVTLLAALFLIVPLSWGGQLHAEATADPLVRAVDGEVYSLGPATPLSIQAANAVKLGAATVIVGYDPALIKPIACTRNTQFNFFVCNMAYDRDDDGVADAVAFSVLSLEGVSAGPAGVAMANISWQAVANVAEPAATLLRVQVPTFSDSDGRALKVTTQDGTLTVWPAQPTPTPTSTSTPRPRTRTYLPLVLRAPGRPGADPQLPAAQGTLLPATPVATRSPADGPLSD
jgi:hypothetical protein